MFSVTAQAQKKKTTKPVAVKTITVPENINTSFQTRYVTTENSKWSRNYSGNYVVNFTNADKQVQSAEYDVSGKLVKAQTIYPTDMVPELITKSLSTKYAGAPITSVSKLELQGVAPYYKVEIDKGNNRTKELFISEEGTIAE
jgi:hypothetical protein